MKINTKYIQENLFWFLVWELVGIGMSIAIMTIGYIQPIPAWAIYFFVKMGVLLGVLGWGMWTMLTWRRS